MIRRTENMYFDKVEGSDTLVIAFTGLGGKLMLQPFEFFSLTNIIGYSKILMRDPTRRLCLSGIDRELNSFQGIIEELRNIIAELKPNKTFVIGTSGGAFTALLVGHIIKADLVHAFAPYPYANILNIIRYADIPMLLRYYKTIYKLYSSSLVSYKYFDLKKVLSDWNGNTQYYIHVCKDHYWDLKRAFHLKDCRNVWIIKYNCNSHNVVRHMHKKGALVGLFSEGAEIEQLAVANN